jgi:hypothetical protein
MILGGSSQSEAVGQRQQHREAEQKSRRKLVVRFLARGTIFRQKRQKTWV